jgi:AraC-like DNA-binding protein/mannose-6-phosphate isomerase-like protein (cupin superfamily)
MVNNIVFPPLTDRQHHETFEDGTCLLDHVPIVGYQRYVEAVPNGLIPEAHPNSYEFHYIVRGSLDWWVNDETYQVKPGMVFMTKPGEMHGSVDSFFQPTELYWFQLRMPRSRPMSGLGKEETASLRQGLASMTHRMFPASPQVRSCFDRILDEHRFPSAGSRIVARTALHQLIVFLIRDHDINANTRGGNKHLSAQIMKAAELIAANLEDRLPIDVIADEVGMSPGHFRTRFRQETGSTPHEYLTGLRIAKAKEMLKLDRWSVTDVAFRLGYSSSQNFASTFKRQTGMTPTLFRKASKADIVKDLSFHSGVEGQSAVRVSDPV